MHQVAKFVVLQMLRGYKWALSPLFPPACRFVPTCSEYAMEAVDRYGAVRGGGMALVRLLRCHPFARGGYDPVQGLKPDSSLGLDVAAGSSGLLMQDQNPHFSPGTREMGHPGSLTSGFTSGEQSQGTI